MRTGSTVFEQPGGYTVSVTSTADQGSVYAVVSPTGVPLYTFSDGPTALEEAAVLNSDHARKPSLWREPR
jgi:hypothetical protein